jgi:DNA-binding MarR family transcriptional regulator
MKVSSSGAKLTELILETFRLNGELIAAGDRLVGDLDLTSARWQVLGTLPDGPATVAEIARRMGLTRQSVQRIADRLVIDGLVTTEANPAHRRAKLYLLTTHGMSVMEEVNMRQGQWANQLVEGVDIKQLTDAISVMNQINQRLKSNSINS